MTDDFFCEACKVRRLKIYRVWKFVRLRGGRVAKQPRCIHCTTIAKEVNDANRALHNRDKTG
jgi:hypothetical protein